jgi:hypothetical protein
MLTRLHRLFVNPLGAALCGVAIDTVTSTGTAIGASLAATAVAPGDTLQIKNCNGTSAAWMLNFWAKNQAAGEVRIRSPKMHDNVDNIRARVQSGVVTYLQPLGVRQRLYGQDVMVVELAGSAVGGQIEDVVQMLYYEDLQGQASRLIDEPTLRNRMVFADGSANLLTVRAAITCGTTAGYGGSLAINNNSDLLQANTDYAVLGMDSDLRVAAITIKGPDTGNLRIPVPGELTIQHIWPEWFRRLSNNFGLPLIPVINSANKGATLIETVSDQAGGTANVRVYLAKLKPA